MTEKTQWDKDCTGCGYCCQQSPCLYGLLLHGADLPCPYLTHRDGRYWCGLLLVMKGDLRARIARSLCIGEGCIGPWMKETMERLNVSEV